jgi:hypothetical protein
LWAHFLKNPAIDPFERRLCFRQDNISHERHFTRIISRDVMYGPQMTTSARVDASYLRTISVAGE